MKKINWKLINVALWIELILSYLLPFWITDGSHHQVGFPVPFLTIYSFHESPFMSMHLNPTVLLFNAIIIYLILTVCIRVYQKAVSKTRDRGRNVFHRNTY